mgnify:CR=1 FL=1
MVYNYLAFGCFSEFICFSFTLFSTGMAFARLDVGKTGFVVVLYAYHIKCHLIFKELQNDVVKWTSNQMRLWNEGSTLILFAVIFLVIIKDALNWIYGVLGIFLLAGMLMLGIKMYKRIRTKNPDA